MEGTTDGVAGKEEGAPRRRGPGPWGRRPHEWGALARDLRGGPRTVAWTRRERGRASVGIALRSLRTRSERAAASPAFSQNALSAT